MKSMRRNHLCNKMQLWSKNWCSLRSSTDITLSRVNSTVRWSVMSSHGSSSNCRSSFNNLIRLRTVNLDRNLSIITMWSRCTIDLKEVKVSTTKESYSRLLFRLSIVMRGACSAIKMKKLSCLSRISTWQAQSTSRSTRPLTWASVARTTAINRRRN